MNARHALTTERLDLAPATPAFADLTWPFLNDESMWHFFPALRPPTIEALRDRYERWSHDAPYLGAIERWENWICFRKDGAAVGEAQATFAGTNVYIAYGIFSPFRRNGFAREAMRAVLTHAAELHGARRAIAEMAVGNAASIAVAESLGFERVTRHARDDALGYEGESYVYRLMLP